MAQGKQANLTFEQEEAHPEENTRRRPDCINEQRVLIVISRGTKRRQKFVARELVKIMSHAKTHSKIEIDQDVTAQIKKHCQKAKCENFMYFEVRKTNQYLWIGKSPSGPSAFLHVVDYNPLHKSKYTGNFMIASRTVFSFGPQFDVKPEYHLLKELLVDSLNVPKNYPRTQRYLEKVMAFELVDGLIYVRMFQIKKNESIKQGFELIESGPRMTLQLVKIFSETLGGNIFYENPNFKAPEAKKVEKKQKKIKKVTPKDEQEIKWENVDEDDIEAQVEEFTDDNEEVEDEDDE
jgi:ribosome biogenesis protein BRX1